MPVGINRAEDPTSSTDNSQRFLSSSTLGSNQWFGSFVQEHLQDSTPNFSEIISSTSYFDPSIPTRIPEDNQVLDITNEPESPDPLDLFQYTFCGH